MKKFLLILLSFITLGCSATSSRIDSSYDGKLQLSTKKTEKEIIQAIIITAQRNGFEQKILNQELGYIQYQTPMTLTTYPMEVTIFIKNNAEENTVEITAMNANKNSLIPLAKSQVYRAIEDFSEELKKELKSN